MTVPCRYKRGEMARIGVARDPAQRQPCGAGYGYEGRGEEFVAMKMGGPPSFIRRWCPPGMSSLVIS